MKLQRSFSDKGLWTRDAIKVWASKLLWSFASYTISQSAVSFALLLMNDQKNFGLVVWCVKWFIAERAEDCAERGLLRAYWLSNHNFFTRKKHSSKRVLHGNHMHKSQNIIQFFWVKDVWSGSRCLNTGSELVLHGSPRSLGCLSICSLKVCL